jgi:hypothetical protein
MTNFAQVSDNSFARAVSNSLNNTTSPIVLSGIDTRRFNMITTGYIVTIYDDGTYDQDPSADPQMEKAVVTAATIGLSGSLTISRPNAKTHAGTPVIAALVVSQHLTDLDAAVNAAEANITANTSAIALKANTSSLATVATTGSYTDLTNKPTIPAAYTDTQASAAAPVQSVAGRTGSVTLTKTDVGLGNVDNTSDAI